MNVLAFDIASGGLVVALFDEKLAAANLVEIPWHIKLQPDGAAVLTVAALDNAVVAACARFKGRAIDALSFSAFMHNLVLLDESGQPVSPIFTWMDQRGGAAVERLRRQFGEEFHYRTGCRYHPMFPVFKLGSLRLPGVRRISSAKAFLIEGLTGACAEDRGTASTTGFYNACEGIWDERILESVGLSASFLPQLVERDAIVGNVSRAAAAKYGLPEGTPLIAGSGDGFLANAGSACDIPGRVAVTLGTSASVRRVLPSPFLDDATGTFCYHATSGSYLVGCASNNGGNVLDWARATFAALPTEPTKRLDVPVFIPHLYGERSPDWDSSLKARWQGVSAHHSREDLVRAVVEGVMFNLVHYVEILARTSPEPIRQAIISGNGFGAPLTASTLAAVLDVPVLRPRDAGLASLRGAAACGFRGLGVDPSAVLEGLVANAEVVRGVFPEETRARYRRYREVRDRALETK